MLQNKHIVRREICYLNPYPLRCLAIPGKDGREHITSRFSYLVLLTFPLEGRSRKRDKMDKVNFLPWVGKNYASNNYFGKRIMVLGESHHFDKNDVLDCNATTDVVGNTYLNQRKGLYTEYNRSMNTFLKFERALVNRYTTADESSEIWNSLVFYNYLQESLDAPRVPVKEILYKEAEVPFLQVINKYQPDKLIVWSDRLYWHLPEICRNNSTSIVVDGKSHQTSSCLLESGKVVDVICIMHPAASRFSWHRLHNAIDTF